MANYGFIDVSTAKPNQEFQKFVEKNSGPFIGTVINNRDPMRLGRLAVNIASRTGETKGDQTNEVICRYMSPFWGTKTPSYISDDNANSYEGSQHSYGMWMVPPDIGTKVMVIFVEGDANQGYWMGCIPEPYLNHMTPGIGATDNTGVAASGDFDQNKLELYGTNVLPAGEANARILAKSSGAIKQPIHPFTETLRQQGLIQDTTRGTTTSSARRESPSQVYGISTPGRKNLATPELPVGGRGSKLKERINRLTGQTFVMDDGEENGDNQLIRLRSASGHQILLHDTAGVVYIANGSGNAWMEFSSNGSIDVYSGGSVNLRARGDINYHSDSNINMFSANDIKISAGRKLVLDGYIIQNYADQDISFQATTGSIVNKAPTGSFVTDVGQNIIQQASGVQHLIGSQIHFNSIGRINNLISTIERTTVQDPSGTGTKREYIADVNPVAKYLSGPLKVYPQGNVSMSGMRVPTHEPYPYHYDQIVSFVGLDPSLNDNIPGTPEFIAQRNRTSDNPTIRIGQFQADLQRNMEKLGYQLPTAVNKSISQDKSGTNITKIQQIADEFTRIYNRTYDIKDLGPLKLSPLTAGVSSAVEQTVNAFTGKAVNFLKDQVFVNTNGSLLSAKNLNVKIPIFQSDGVDISSVKQSDVSVQSMLTAGNKNIVTESLINILDNKATKTLSESLFGTEIYDDDGAVFRTPGIVSSIGKLPTIPGLGNVQQGISGNIDLGQLSANLANNQLNTIISNSSTLTSAAGVVGQVSQINDLTGGALAKVGKDVLFGSSPLGDFDSGTKGLLGSYGQAGIGGVLQSSIKNFQGGVVTAVTNVSTAFSNFGTKFSSAVGSVASAVGNIFKGFSDVRLKENIKHIQSHNGINWYSFTYKWDVNTIHIGVMAQEILSSKYSYAVEVDPITGYFVVDYGKL